MEAAGDRYSGGKGGGDGLTAGLVRVPHCGQNAALSGIVPPHWTHFINDPLPVDAIQRSQATALGVFYRKAAKMKVCYKVGNVRVSAD